MTELSKGEIVATLMGRELSKRVGRAHQRISDAERRTAAEIASLRAVEDAYAQNLDGVRDSLGQLASATVAMASAGAGGKQLQQHDAEHEAQQGL